MVKDVEIKALHQFYRSLSEIVGTEAMLRIHSQYKGTQLSIPIHLYDRRLAAQLVREEFNGNNQLALAHKYGYSQKWVYKVLRQGEVTKQKEE
ncbi:Mor transcription activator family protein [Levilactobacillus paucivorans]|uniref:Mor transcription activator family protein n=1 Tax=Levilactobacillus paucivorans TaxID=616990 RepID=UPI00070D1922|nr:Mor transcription activator family protein [Levilactobacillus paucivorans]